MRTRIMDEFPMVGMGDVETEPPMGGRLGLLLVALHIMAIWCRRTSPQGQKRRRIDGAIGDA